MKTSVGRGACAVFSYMRDCLEKYKKKLFKNLTEMLMFPYRSYLIFVLEIVLLWIRAGFECCDGIRTPYMEEI